MNKKKILLLCLADPNKCPRPNRMIQCLKEFSELTVIGTSPLTVKDVRSFAFQPDPVITSLQHFLRIIHHKQFNVLRTSWLFFVYLFTHQYEKALGIRLTALQKLFPALRDEHFDLIISHDLLLLPFAFMIKKPNTFLFFDAREYYPKEADHQWTFKFTYKPLAIHLCTSYLKRCDQIFTVSEGLAEEYQREFGVKPKVMLSLPFYYDLHPSTVNHHHFRMIHHGYCLLDRKIEKMIEMMDYVDERFSLDLMLLPSHGAYWNKILSMVNTRKNVRLIPPVSFPEIVPFTNSYDIGLYLCPPTNFNTTYNLPNKFFEFIQARLAVAIGPSIEMRKIVEKYQCGIVAEDFEPQTLAKHLNQLTPHQLETYKHNSHLAAAELNAEKNCHWMREIIAQQLK